MASSIDSSALLFPEGLFEQDYLVFLSFFGWMLLGLLAWTKPLCDRQSGETQWVWFGYFAFAEAMADFIRTLSFSDPFFRTFSIETPLEMLGLGCLIELSLRRLERYKEKSVPPFAAIACALLGFAIEVSSMLYSVFVAFLVSAVACLWFAFTLGQIARKTKRSELYVILCGILILIPAWLLHPGHMAFIRNETLVTFNEFPFYGFALLFLRILAAWVVLGGFWYYRLQARIDDVGRRTQSRLRFWGYRVLPSALGAVVLASYLVTTWNGRRESERMETGFLSRSQTAVLAIDEVVFQMAWNSDGTAKAGYREALAASLKSIRGIGTDVSRVYLWNRSTDGIEVLLDESEETEGTVVGAHSASLIEPRERDRNKPFVLGPIKVGPNLALNVSSPILDKGSGETLGWVGMDLGATSWMKNISLARLQTIVIAGLVLALAIFFFYYQIENESETDLALAKERAEAADRAKSEFLAVISHEIRTPLQSVLGYSNLLRATSLDQKQLSCLDTIQSEGKILLRIVQDILDFSNLRKASSGLKEGRVALRNLIDETYCTIRPMAEKKGLTAELDVGEGLPAIVQADGVRLRQVLLNLYGNSVKYTDRGTVRLSIGNRVGEGTSGALDFIISDTGVGIEKSDLGRLFEPFIQLEHAGTSPREGAGLGLAIVKRIVELMGGSISVESEFGRGSTFTASFDFTVLEETEEESGGASPDEASDEDSVILGERYPLKVLVADDNPMVRRLIVQYLEALGYTPDQVDDGIPASEMGSAYDLVVTDLRMPGMDGPSAAAIIREKSGLDDQPWIIGISATLAEAEIERAMNSGINDFLGKPFFTDDLEKRIKAIPWLDKLANIGEGDVFSKKFTMEVEDSNKIEEKFTTAFAGSGMAAFSEDVIETALKEVFTLCEQMEAAIGSGDFEFVKEKAHYISNTAMAIGIERLYFDSKYLQVAASSESDEVRTLLERLEENFADWERSRK